MAPVLIRNLSQLPPTLCGGAVSIGNFDGVHRGHARIIKRLVTRARDLDGAAIVFTFDPHPAQLLKPDAVPPPLTWTERKAQLLGELGADAVIAYPTDPALLELTPGEFFERTVQQGLAARAIVEGPNFYFGRGRAGSINTLAELCQATGIMLDVVEPLKVAGSYVSSSRIRGLIGQGRVREAHQLLTQPYRVRGRVVRGAGRGATIGFATANIDPVDMLLPPLGVYAGRVSLAGIDYAAAINIGTNPTFGETTVKFEVHLIGLDQSLYGEILEVDFLDRLRDVQSFSSVEQLQRQLAADVQAARTCLQPDRVGQGGTATDG